MIFHASLLASQGHDVLIVAANNAHARSLESRVRQEVPGSRQARILIQALDDSVNLLTCTSNRHKDRLVLIDHIVLETHLARSLKMLMQYEAPENSNRWHARNWNTVLVRIE